MIKLKDLKKLKWKCKYCSDILISDPCKRHKMDICECGKTGLDLEIYYSRSMGDGLIKIKDIPFIFKDERLKPRWTTYGKNFEYPEGKKVSVSEMSDEHIKSILKSEIYLSEVMSLLLNKEIKYRGKPKYRLSDNFVIKSVRVAKVNDSDSKSYYPDVIAEES